MAKGYGKTEEEMLQNQYLKDYLEDTMKVEKALEFIVKNAKYKK